MFTLNFLYVYFGWSIGICYGFVLLSSAAGQQGEIRLFVPGESLEYDLHSTVLLNEVEEGAKSVGFYISGSVVVDTVWGSALDRVLRIQVKNPLLHIKSRKAPSPDGFISHKSKLDEFSNKPFYLISSNGIIEKILVAKDEQLSLVNFKKGIASLLQLQILDGESQELDASGDCKVQYYSTSPHTITKTKTNCVSKDLPYLKTPEPILEAHVNSIRKVEYQINSATNNIQSIVSKEEHFMIMQVNEKLGNKITVDHSLKFLKSGTCEKIDADNKNKAVDSILGGGVKYSEETLQTENEDLSETGQTFVSSVNTFRSTLGSHLLGTLAPAKTFIRMVKIGRKSSREDIAKALGSKKNVEILPQLYDVLGFVQTYESHDAAMKKLYFDQESHLDNAERYLWALSMSTNPAPEIISDLLERYRKNSNILEKVEETLILTVAAMGHRLAKSQPGLHSRILGDIEQTILNNLDYAKNEDRYVFIRALKNLKSPTTIPVLLQIIQNGTPKEGLLAWQAIKAFGPKFWEPTILKQAHRTFFQIGNKQYSSSRTISADILLESNPSEETLGNLLHHLKSNDTMYEMKQYIWQRIKTIAGEDDAFKEQILGIVKSNKDLNNYSVLAPRGLSNSLKRKFLNTPSVNGSLLSIQEINGGLVKQGLFDVSLEKNNLSKEIFSLRIFTGGLNGVISSYNNEVGEETATAGLELTVLGTHLRPFVFFDGQGELMGHVWSGTASEKTPAYQATVLLQDHLEYLRLGSGMIATLDLKGAASFDLSGKIEISLWSRTAETLVEKSAGVFVEGIIKVDTSFVRSQVEFISSLEPKLTLNSNIEFSGKMSVCVRFAQPDTLFKHNIFKIERIPGSKHKLRIAKYKKSISPGITYSLSRKNNQMCSAIF